MKTLLNGRLPGILADAHFVQKTKENLRNFVKTTEKGEKQLKYNKNTLFILNILHNEYRRIFKKKRSILYVFL